MHVLHCVLHAVRQCQANELLLWDRPDECFVFVLHVLRQCQANGLLLCDCPDACFALCFTRVEAKLELLLWDRPDSCFVLLCVSTEAISC